jgi:Fe-S cluster biogenesis protein NfuA
MWDGFQHAIELGLESCLGGGLLEAKLGQKQLQQTQDNSTRVNDDDNFLLEIEDILDEKVRPNLQSDGGDVQVRGFDKSKGILQLRLLGACRSCPSATVTLRFMIRNLLVHHFEEITDVEQVWDQGDLVQDKGIDWTG